MRFFLKRENFFTIYQNFAFSNKTQQSKLRISATNRNLEPKQNKPVKLFAQIYLFTFVIYIYIYRLESLSLPLWRILLVFAWQLHVAKVDDVVIV